MAEQTSFDCVAYLKSVLPSLLSGPAPKSAVIQMIVVDRDDCDLTYRIDATGIAVTEGVSDRVDLTLAFVSRDLSALSTGTLDVARALRTKRLKVMGDESLLAWMARRLAA